MQTSLFQRKIGKVTRTQRLFNEVTPHIPFGEWDKMIFPVYKKKTDDGCPKKAFDTVLRAYLARMFLGMSYEQIENALHENETVRNFCGININDDIPSDSSIFRFETLLTENGFQKKMFKEHVDGLIIGGKIIKKGTNVDSTIVDAPTSKRNEEKSKDPEAGWTKKAGNHRHGFKGHTGTDEDSGLIHSVKFTAANEHDLAAVEDILHGEEERNPYSNIKRIFNFRYTRTRGIKKNEARFTFLCLLSNIYKLSRTPKKKKSYPQGSTLPISQNSLQTAS